MQRTLKLSGTAALSAVLIGVSAPAATAAPAASCLLQASAPYRAADGSITGHGSTSCSGYIRLMERRIFWTDRQLARVDFSANPDPWRTVIRPCNGGGDGGDVYVQIRADSTGETKNSSLTYFGYCT